MEGLPVARPVVTAAKCLSGVGEPVAEVREYREELHEQCVDGQNEHPLPRTGCREREKHGHEKECSQEYVAVDNEETDKCFASD